MAFAIAVSLIVAFTLTPMMAQPLAPRSTRATDRTDRGTSRTSSAPIERRLPALLRWSHAPPLGRRAGLRRWRLASIVPLFMVGGKDFLPKNDESQFEINVRAPEGTHRRADRADR